MQYELADQYPNIVFIFLFYFNLCYSGATSICGALLEMIWMDENSKGSMHQLMDLPPACTPSSLHPPCNPSVWNNHTALQDRLGSRRSASCLGSAFGCWVVAGAKDVPRTQILCSARGSLAEQQNYYWYIYFWSGYLFFNWSELNYSQACPCYSQNCWCFPQNVATFIFIVLKCTGQMKSPLHDYIQASEPHRICCL